MDVHWIYLPTTVSTNVEAARLLAAGEINSTAIVCTDYQESGRGQGNNTWVSEAEKNLLMSWIVFPAFLSVDRQFRLSKLVAVAITDLLRERGMNALIKWPNDILIEKRKIGGILIEHSLLGQKIRSTIAGVGINVNQQEFPVFNIPATSILAETGKFQDLVVFRGELAGKLQHYYGQLSEGDSGAIDRRYHDRLYGLGQKHLFVMDKRHKKEGIIRGVNVLGELLVEHAGTTGSYGMHEIRMEIVPG